MCGIAGIISKGQIGADHHAAINRMLTTQHHRGPDHTAQRIVGESVILGHNRLSIIDLSEHANQPFSLKETKRWTIVFNGEIYNYLELQKELADRFNFTSSSDTEVLLASYIKWGKNCLDKLIGMFAFAIYDDESKELFLCRDRFGVKPLYFGWHKTLGFMFASEIKTLHAAGLLKIKNIGVWSAYLSEGRYQYKDETFWQGIYQLNAGSYVTINIKSHIESITQVKWYSFIENIHDKKNDAIYLNRNRKNHLSEYQQILENSIKLRFRSDVPVGFNISGGLDSSTLLGAVHKLFPSSPIEAFTFYCQDERYDELPWVKDLIAQTNKPLNQVLLTAQSIQTLHDKLSQYQDEPYGGIPTIAYSQIFRSAREKGILVLLDGQGMDEAWAGYDYYHSNSNSIVQGVKSTPLKKNVLNPDFANAARIETYPTPFGDPLLDKQYRDLFFTKIPRALRFNDRVSMMYATELREPFLDHQLVEYAFALPQEMKVQQGQVKWALRQLAQQYLTGEIHLAPKRALQTPQREWLTDDLSDWVEDHVTSLKQHPWFDKKMIEKEWSNFKKSEKDNTFFLWQWLSV